MTEGRPFEKLDVSRYDLVPPSGQKANDLAEWKRVAENAQAQIEHSRNRLMNLEMMQKYGERMWVKHLSDLEIYEESLKRESQRVRKAVEDTNKFRKLEQVGCGNDLRNLTREWEEYVERNGKISEAISLLENDICQLETIHREE